MNYWLRFVTLYRRQGSRPSPCKKKCKKNTKWLSGKALQIAVKGREVKSKGEKERYKHLNAEFQRIARRDKKTFFSDQCKEIEENNRMGKTRDLFKKIRYQGNISCKGELAILINHIDVHRPSYMMQWEGYLTSVVFFPKIQNTSLIMREHWLNWGIFYKIHDQSK